jgi:hypothetical protein
VSAALPGASENDPVCRTTPPYSFSGYRAEVTAGGLGRLPFCTSVQVGDQPLLLRIVPAESTSRTCARQVYVSPSANAPICQDAVPPELIAGDRKLDVDPPTWVK